MFGAFVGWLIEVIFRAVKERRLVNPGFLSGPYLPLYGFGIIILYGLSNIDFSFIESGFLRIVCMISIITISLTLIELAAGLIFVYGLKIKLWDYSKLKFNFMGIVHPLFSLVWGAFGTGYYFLIHPWLSVFSDTVSTSLVVVLLIGVTYGIFFFDLGHSFGVSAKIRNIAANLQIVINYEKLKKNYRQKLLSGRQKTKFFNPFRFASYSVNFEEAMTESIIYKKSEMKIKIKDKENSGTDKKI